MQKNHLRQDGMMERWNGGTAERRNGGMAANGGNGPPNLFKVHTFQGYTSMQAWLPLPGRSFFEVEISRLPHSCEDVVQVCLDC